MLLMPDKSFKIPESVQIGPYTVNVVEEENFWHTEGSEGAFYPNKDKIVLDSQLNPARKIEVFIHEVMEAIIRSYDQKIDHTTLVILSMGLTQALKPVLVEKEDDK